MPRKILKGQKRRRNNPFRVIRNQAEWKSYNYGIKEGTTRLVGGPET